MTQRDRVAIMNDKRERRERNRVWDAARSAAEREIEVLRRRETCFLSFLSKFLMLLLFLLDILRGLDVYVLMCFSFLKCITFRVSLPLTARYTRARLTFGVDGSAVLCV